MTEEKNNYSKQPVMNIKFLTIIAKGCGPMLWVEFKGTVEKISTLAHIVREKTIQIARYTYTTKAFYDGQYS